MKITIPAPKTNQKITIFDTYISLLMLIPITTLVQYYIPFINVALFIIVFIFQGLVVLQRIDKRSIVFLAISIIGYVIVLMQTKNLKFDNQIVYYINWLLFATVISQNVDRFTKWIEENEFYTKMIMLIWSVVVAVSIPLPSSYYSKEGAGRYFRSFTESIFRLGPTALFIECLALISIIVYKHRRDIIYMLLPLFCGFMGSSRTYFIVIVAVFILGLYFFSTTRFRFWLMAIPAGAAGIVAFSFSSMSEKVKYTLDENQFGDLLFRVSSGRSLLWERIWDRYVNLSSFRQFFGSGFGYTNRINHGLYAHNDFIEILATHGVFGLILYLFCIYILYRTFFKNKKVPLGIIGICVFVWLFNAMFNMFYWYTSAAFSLPFMLAAISYFYTRQKQRFPSRNKNGKIEQDGQ